MPISTYSEKKNLRPYLAAFSHYWALNSDFLIGKTKNIEKRLLQFDLRILLAVKIFMRDVENPKKPKNRLPLLHIHDYTIYMATRNYRTF
jgi:hypothetical protein